MIYQGIEYTTNDIKEHIKNQLEMEKENNLKLIKYDIEHGELGGKYIRGSRGQIFYVAAASSTIEDYYWVLLDTDRKVYYDSCVAKPGEILEYIPASMSVLQYIIDNDPECLAEDIRNAVENAGEDVLFTKINLGGKLY